MFCVDETVLYTVFIFVILTFILKQKEKKKIVKMCSVRLNKMLFSSTVYFSSYCRINNYCDISDQTASKDRKTIDLILRTN